MKLTIFFISRTKHVYEKTWTFADKKIKTKSISRWTSFHGLLTSVVISKQRLFHENKKLFWSAFYRIWTEYEEIHRNSPYSVRMRENADQKISLNAETFFRNYCDPHFPTYGLNTKRYSVSLRIQSEFGKMRTRITPNTDTFYAVQDCAKPTKLQMPRR